MLGSFLHGLVTCMYLYILLGLISAYLEQSSIALQLGVTWTCQDIS